jgi:hypothetical protein
MAGTLDYPDGFVTVFLMPSENPGIVHDLSHD